MKSCERILVTGSAGFIGFHTAMKLVNDGHVVLGVDSLNEYYDVNLKKARVALLQRHPHFSFVQADLVHGQEFGQVATEFSPTIVIHLAAQAGVRCSLTNPKAYIDSNLIGFFHVIELCRSLKPKHLVFASSSSVYGANANPPFSTHHNVDHPVSLYAATKKANELMAHSYSHLFSLPVTGLRFFTVYGPWGRPDMAIFLFTKAILEGRPINLFNFGKMRRDFTFIDDIVEGVCRVSLRPPVANEMWNGKSPDPATSRSPYRLYNIGNGAPVELMAVVSKLENLLGRKADVNFLPMQAGDVLETCADVTDLVRDFDFRPKTAIDDGLRRFTEWYRAHYKC